MTLLCQSGLLTFSQGYLIFWVGRPQDYGQTFTSLQHWSMAIGASCTGELNNSWTEVEIGIDDIQACRNKNFVELHTYPKSENFR